MAIGPFQGWEIVALLLIILIIFGPSKLPALARSVGESIRELRKVASEAEREERDEGRGG